MTFDPSALGDVPLTDSDRQTVLASLRAHREAGHLDSTAYEAREVGATAARTWADVFALFTDLPEPHPRPQGTASYGTPPSAAPPQTYSEPAQPVITPSGQPVPQPAPQPPAQNSFNWLNGLWAIIPLLALLLFMVTRQWIWFLAIPIVYTFLGAARGGKR